MRAQAVAVRPTTQFLTFVVADEEYAIEILRIRDTYLEARGVPTQPREDIPVEVLRDFHDELCGSGRLPVGLAEQAVMSTIPG